AFPTAFHLIMGGGWWMVRNGARRYRGDGPFAGFRVWTDSLDRLHVKVSNPGPLWAGIAATVVSFILLFVIAFGSGGNPSLALMLVTWAGIIACAIIAYRRARTDGSKPREIVLDPRSVTLDIFRQSKVTPDKTVLGSAIQTVTVEKKEDTDSEGDVVRTFTPVIIGTDEDGNPKREE